VERYIRFQYEDSIYSGILCKDVIEVLKGSNPEEFEETGVQIESKKVKLLTPCTPEKIICSGLNYYDTVLEEGAAFPKKPLIFLKPPSSIIQPGEKIVQNKMVNMLTCEAELGAVISKKCKNISFYNAMDYVWGYIIANDVTAKDLQKEDNQWTRAKSFDTFLPLGSEIVSGVNAENLQISSYINNKKVQDGNTKDLIFNIACLISYISHCMTLKPGDIIITGTPGGYGKIIDAGDEVTIEIEELGRITNTVVKDDGSWCLT
jgi:2-keto-4-pentenoate hydratase/2-oxohepta-3-ene-1,7-dioic acid hydratase in catechol pathway